MGKSLGKTVILAKDTPGFIVNYLQYLFRLNAIRMLEAGMATREDIDAAATLGLGHEFGPPLSSCVLSSVVWEGRVSFKAKTGCRHALDKGQSLVLGVRPFQGVQQKIQRPRMVKMIHRVKGKRIAYLVATACTGKLSGELSRREKVLRAIADPGTQIDILGLENDPTRSCLYTSQSDYDGALSTPEDIKCALEAEKRGYQAVIIACGADPGMNPLREVLRIPVIAPGSAAKHLCSMLGPRFSVLTTGKGGPFTTEIHERDGLLKFVSIHPIGLTVPEVRSKPGEAYKAMVREGKRAVREYGACAVTYGCMSMGFLMVDEKLTKAIGVSAINPVRSAVRLAEMFVDLGITHSKLSFPLPPSLKK
jgi:allantoin racemase